MMPNIKYQRINGKNYLYKNISKEGQNNEIILIEVQKKYIIVLISISLSCE